MYLLNKSLSMKMTRIGANAEALGCGNAGFAGALAFGPASSAFLGAGDLRPTTIVLYTQIEPLGL